MIPHKGQRDPNGSLDHTLRTVVSVKLKHIYQEECDRLFLAVLFVIEKKWETTQISPISRRVNK